MMTNQPPEDLVPPRPSYPEREMGGLVSQEEAGVTPSNVLMRQATARMPAELQTLLANRKIDRPPFQEGFVENNPLGWYQPPELGSSGDIAVRRDAEMAPSDVGTPADIAQHEVLHALSYEHPYWSEDAAANWPDLLQATRDSVGRGQYPQVDAYLARLLTLRKDDPMHLFTDLGRAGLQDRRYLPPPLQKYFAPLLGDRYSTIPPKQR